MEIEYDVTALLEMVRVIGGCEEIQCRTADAAGTGDASRSRHAYSGLNQHNMLAQNCCSPQHERSSLCVPQPSVVERLAFQKVHSASNSNTFEHDFAVQVFHLLNQQEVGDHSLLL